MRNHYLLGLALLLSSRSLFAQATINVPADQPTIQAGINAANNGDTVLVAPGTYYENIDFKGKTLAVNSSGGAASTIIDGGGKGPVAVITGPFVVAGSIAPGLKGFTIQNGGLPSTPGAPYGGIYIDGQLASVQYDIITRTMCAGVVAIDSSVVADGNEINETLTPAGCPAGEGYGSGIFYFGALNNSSGIIEANTIEQNTNSVAASSDKGGGGGINIQNAGTLLLYDNIIRNNTTTGYGGGIYTANSPSLYIEGNLIYGNKGISGGMDIVIPGATTGPIAGLIANNTIAENSGIGATSNVASDLFLGGNLAQYVLINNIIVGYTNGQSALNCAVAYQAQTITPLVFDHNDIYSVTGSGNTPVGGACTSPAGTFGNISVDPQFVLATSAALAAGTSNFQLKSGSAAIDTGNNDVYSVYRITPDIDLNNVTRPQDGTVQGYRIIDMGAYEFSPSNGSLSEPPASSLLLSADNYAPTVGQSVTLTAQLLAAPPAGGTMTFYEDTVSIGVQPVTGATTTLATAPLTTGLHSFYAVYSGEGTASPATSLQLYLLVNNPRAIPTTITLTSTPNPSNLGQSVTFTANITSTSGTPTGTVTFTDGGTTLGSVPVDSTGNAIFSTAALPIGNRSITAAYAASGNYSGGAASLTQAVTGMASTSTLTATPATTTYGSPITLAVTVAPTSPPGSGTPTGTVTFLVDGAATGSQSLVSGAASEQLTTLTAGSHSFSCSYSGDTTYASSSCNTTSVTVTASSSSLTLKSSANPAFALTPITFTATLVDAANNPIANAAIVLTEGLGQGGLNQVWNGTTDAQGNLTFLNISAYPGTYPYQASYAGDVRHLASSSLTINETYLINPTSITLIASPNPAEQNSPVTVSVSVHATTGVSPPFGSVQIFDGGKLIQTIPQLTLDGLTSALSSGNFAISTLSAGQHSLTATYIPSSLLAGETAFLPSSTSAALSVTILPQTFTFTSSAPSISIQTEHHGSLGLQLTSVGGFAGPIALSCGPTLPAALTCELPPSVSLPANGQIAATLTLDTDVILGFKASLEPPHATRYVVFAGLLPLVLFGLRRRKTLSTLLLTALTFTAAASLTGCSGKYPAHTPPGTYKINLTAIGTATGATTPTTQTLTVTLNVTP